jgi:hypothetical protein
LKTFRSIARAGIWLVGIYSRLPAAGVEVYQLQMIYLSFGILIKESSFSFGEGESEFLSCDKQQDREPE